MKHKHGHHPNSKGNLDPQANSKGGRERLSVMLSKDAIKGAGALAALLGHLRNGKPNRSEAINYVLEAVHWIMKNGGQFTMAEDGKLHLRSKDDESKEV